MFNWIRKLTTTSITSNDIYDLLGGTPTASGIVITPEKILGSTALWRSVNIISNSVARIPLVIYKTGKDGRTKAKFHPAFRLLKKQPSPYVSNFTFWQTIISHAVLYGSGFALIKRDEFGRPTELNILCPENTTALKENGKLLFLNQENGISKNYLPENILHIRGLGNTSELGGYSIAKIMKESLSSDLALTKYFNYYFSNNTMGNVVITLPNALKDVAAIKRFKTSWTNAHAGLFNQHKPHILEDGATVQSLNATLKESSFVLSKQHSIVEIANAVGLPNSFLGGTTTTSYGSLQEDSNRLLGDLEVWLCSIESECEIKLLTEQQKKIGSHNIEFLRESFTQSNIVQKSQMIISEYNNGLLSFEESRKILNRTATKDGEFRRPSNIMVEGEETELVEQIPEVEPPPDPEPTPTEEKLRSLTHKTLQRLITRMMKSQKPVLEHRQIIIDSLEADITVVDEWLISLDNEIENSLPEQRESCFERIDIEELTKRFLCN